jgi:hypothetical protein
VESLLDFNPSFFFSSEGARGASVDCLFDDDFPLSTMWDRMNGNGSCLFGID